MALNIFVYKRSPMHMAFGKFWNWVKNVKKIFNWINGLDNFCV